MQDQIKAIIEQHVRLAETLPAQMGERIITAGDMLIACLESGGKILLCGNGGSAADAQHIATELTGRFMRERKALAAIALTTDSSALTAIGNDYGMELVFARQIEALARRGDVLVAISTSGKSPNVVRAVEAARLVGCVSIGLTGGKGGRLAEIADHALIVPSSETPRIQEMHIVIGHILCEIVDSHFSR